MDWRVARSLDVLLAQLNARAPGRNKASDGSIGDTNHQNRSSDHNPWYGPGIVTARDFTHDPARGLDCHWLAAVLASNRDPRVKYMIWNRRIMSGNLGPSPWMWRAYAGVNPHTSHLHLSVVASPACDDVARWEGINPQEVPKVLLTDPMRPFFSEPGSTWPEDIKNMNVGQTLANMFSHALSAHQLGIANAEALARLEARPIADVDEAALAAELDARDIGGMSAEEFLEILTRVRLGVDTPA